MNLIIHTDGGSRGNPGPAAAAYIIRDSSGRLIKQSGNYLGVTTNNQAEYQAVLQALTWVSQNVKSLRAINFFLDSELVARQLSGQYKIKSKELLPLAIKIKNLQNSLISPISPITQISFHSISRNLNKPADRLVNQVLNDQVGRTSKVKRRE